MGGRSFGGRVACRTAGDVGAAGVWCLAFPLHPPGRPERSRLPELTTVTVPTQDPAQRDHPGRGVGRPLSEEGRTRDPRRHHHLAGRGTTLK
ncbi:alpha/beta family hydrolase [Aeromicrobium sp.]|uniref:alpha/beta family hydrolase n=1 Tax=Aeromicrobium sp. TaxID=1871063 RepID=UPI003D6B08F8